jgi:flagellar motor switch protein FliN/FliY
MAEQELMSDEEIMQAMMGDKVATPAPGAAETGGQGHANLDFILDIPLDVAVELGRARMQIAELLQLGQGSVIELNKLAGEPMEILVNQKLIARGEVVVVNEKFGIRLTDIISPVDRVKQLGG